MSFHEEEILGKAYDARLMRRLLAYLRPHTWYVAGALLALVDARLEVREVVQFADLLPQDQPKIP